MKKLLFSLGLVVALLGATIFTRTQAQPFKTIPSLLPASAYTITSHTGSFVDISSNPNAVALGTDLAENADLYNYFFEPTSTTDMTPVSKKTATNALANTAKTENCFPLGFDFKISGKTMRYFYVTAAGGAYFSPEPTRTPNSWAPSGGYSQPCIHVNLYTYTKSSSSISLQKVGGTGKVSKAGNSAPAYYLIEGGAGNHVLTIQHHIKVLGADEWTYQVKFYEATGNFELVAGDFQTDAAASFEQKAGQPTWYYGLIFGLYETTPATTGTPAINDTLGGYNTLNAKDYQVGMASCPSGGQHKWYASRQAFYDENDNGWSDLAPLTNLAGSKTLQIKPDNKPAPGSTIRFNYPACQDPLPAFPESNYSVGKTNTDNSFTATLTYKNEAILEHGLFDITSMGTIVAISSASPEPDFTLTNGTFYLKGYQFPESEGFVPTVLCNRMPYFTYGTPSDGPIYLNLNNAISVTLSGLTKMDARYIHVFRMSLNCDGKPVYSPLCFTIAREPILDPPALLETVGLPTVNSVKLHVKPAEGASVMIVKSPTSINVSPKGQLKKGSKIGDAEVVDILNAEKTWDVPMKAGEGCYFLAITVNTSNPNKYAYSPANRLWVPARAAYNGFPGLLDMSKELCGIPNKENDGMKLTTQEFKTLEPNIYRDLPFGWTRELTLANGEKQVAFGLGHPGYSINVPVALYATAIYTKACKTDAITVPILANKNRILVTYEMQLWKADASGYVDKANAEDGDQFQLQYALGNGPWVTMTSWTGKTLPTADENGVYKLSYSLVDDGLAGQYIRFRFVLNSVTRNNSTFVAIKSLEIKEDKLCQTPTDLAQTINQTTTTQFPITWADPNATKAASYRVVYRRLGATGDWTEKTVTTTGATLTGLRSSTTYAVYVTAVCGENEESYPTDTTYFTTAYTFPYAEAMAQRDTMFKIQGTNATITTYSPFPGKSMYPAIVRRDGGVNTYTGQLPVQGNNGTADLELANGDGSNAGVFSHINTYYKNAGIKMDDGYGVVRNQLKAVGVSERANYTWLITPVIYTVNLEEGQPLTVRFKARSASATGSKAPSAWTRGSVGSKYSAAVLKVLVSKTGTFGNDNVIGVVNVGSETIDSTSYEFDLSSQLTGSVQVAFYYANTSYINDNAQENNDDYMTFEIFDVRFEYKNDVSICPPLEGLERKSLTPHSATYEWAPSDSAKYYEFAYGPADEDESSENWKTVKLTKAEYTMTGLDDETAYKVKVTGYCDEEGQNAAPDPLEDEFTTPQGCQAPTLKIQDVTYYGATFISSQAQSKTILDKREILVSANDHDFSKWFTQTKDTLVQESGLHDNTSYTAKTRAICRYGAASVDTSEWSNAISFTTPVDPANLPDTFDVKVQVLPTAGGVVTGAKKYVKDEQITLTATPNEGYIFKGWVNSETNDTVSRAATYKKLAALDEEDENDPTIKTHVLSYIAAFRKVYTITLNTEPAGTTGGTVTGAGTYEDGVEVTLKATPKTNYLFVEWQDAEGEQVSKNETYKVTPTANATYTAVFRLKQFFTLDVTVTPNADWGSVTQNPTPNEDDQYQEGKAVTLTAVPAQYCKFVAWKDADGNTLSTNASYTVSMDNNKAVKAEFAQLRYTVTLKSDPNTNYGTIKGTSGSTTTGGTFVAGTTRRLVAQPKSGYAFVKWMSGTKELGTDTVFTFVLSRDTTITAYFKEKDSLSVKVNVEPAGAGTVTGAGKVKRGENAVLTATPAAHYAFKEWRRLDNTTVKTNPYTFKPERDYTFTAVFRNLETYTITVTSEGNGTVSGAGSYEEGASVSLTATADENYHFSEWQDADGSTLSTDETYTFTATGNTTVKAVFVEDAKFTVTLQRVPSSAAGTVSGANSYHTGDEVTISATANKGYQFVEWQKADGTTLSTDNPYTFTMGSANVSYKAVFQALCEIKTTVEPAGAATVTGAGTYENGDEVTLTATVDDAYVFVEWRDATSGIQLSTDNPYVFNATTSQTIKAVLREKAYFSVDVPCVGDDEDEDDPGSVSIPNDVEGSYMEGTTVTMTAKPAQYYEFVEWQDANGNSLSTNPVYSFVISQDTTFTAVFTRIQYTVTLVSNPNKDAGTINGTSGSVSDGGTFDAGSRRHLEAKPKSGYEFVKWMSGSLQLGTNPVLEFILTRDTTITAYFQQKQELDIKVTVDPAGAGSVTGAGKVQRGNNAVLTAIPNNAYKFLYWERIDGTQHEENPYTLVQPQRDYSFTAKFRAKEQYTVTVMTAPYTTAGTVTKTGLLENGKALEDATITLTATPADGHTFVEWQDAADKQVSTNATLTFTATANVVYKAVFEEIPVTQYTVTLLRDPVAGGRIFGDGEYDENSEATIRATANTGYTFDGWYNGTTLVSTDNPYKFTVTADVTYTAKFKEREYVDVTVDVLPEIAAGSVSGANTYEKGKQVTLTATAKEGYVFYRWVDVNNDNAEVSTTNPYIFTATKDVHYAAEFRGQYEVALNILPDESAGDVTGAGFYPQGRSVTIKATAAEGYIFEGWYDGETKLTADATYTFTVQGNVSYTAKFEAESEDEYTITLRKLPTAEAGTVKGNGRYAIGEEVTLTATPSENYMFVAWLKPKAEDPTQYDTVSKRASYKITVEGNATYVALFRVRARYTIEVDIVPNDNAGEVTGDGEYREGRTVTLEATPNAGYVFVAWVVVSDNPSPKDTVSRTSTYTFTASKNATYKAVFKKTQAKYYLNLTVSPAGAGTVTGDGIYSANQTVTVTATPNPGYTFVGWRLLNGSIMSRDLTYTFQISRDMTITAVFSKNPQMTVTLNAVPEEGGTVTGDGKYEQGSTVTITATPAEGYSFVEWQDAEGNVVSADASYTFVVTANVTYTALFKQNGAVVAKEYTIDLNVLPERIAGTVTGAGTYKEGTMVTISATANSGYSFVQWQDAAGRMLSEQSTYTFEATANVIYSALFEKNVDTTRNYTVTLNVLPNLNAGSVEGNGVYRGGEKATITAKPAAGYVFVAWLNGSDTLSKQATYSFIVGGDVTYAALFAKATANEQQLKAAFNVGAGNGRLYIENINDVVVKDVTVFNTVGRRVAHFAPNRRGNLTLPVDANASVLVVRVVSEQGAGVYKVYLH